MTTKNHQNLLFLIDCLMLDNYGVVYSSMSIDTWSWPEEVDFDKLEQTASTMSMDELDTFACGEESDIRALIIDSDRQDLNDFLNELFDGKYTEFLTSQIKNLERELIGDHSWWSNVPPCKKTLHNCRKR